MHQTYWDIYVTQIDMSKGLPWVSLKLKLKMLLSKPGPSANIVDPRLRQARRDFGLSPYRRFSTANNSCFWAISRHSQLIMHSADVYSLQRLASLYSSFSLISRTTLNCLTRGSSELHLVKQIIRLIRLNLLIYTGPKYRYPSFPCK